jgi:hypothetical protein
VGFEVKTGFRYIIVAAVVILAVSAARPYWDRYWIGKEVEAAAVYGTKNSPKDTLKYLTDNLTRSGYDFRQDDFHIEKTEKHRVTISIQYNDSIRIYTFVLKELNLSIEKTASEVSDY